MRLYNVKTYDAESGEFTPQEGLTVPSQGIPIWGVRTVLKELRAMGYPCDYTSRPGHSGDPAVLVEALE